MPLVKYLWAAKSILGGCRPPQPSRTYRRLPRSRRSFLLGEGQDLSQRTYHNDVAATTFLARMDFNVTYERTDNVHGLRARPVLSENSIRPGFAL